MSGASVVAASSLRPHGKLIVFLRAPRLGEVKTRLACSMGACGALDVYLHLVATLLHRLRDWPDVELRFTPDDAKSEVAPFLRSGWKSHPQGSGDLGVRMHRAFADALTAGAAPVLLIGSDCPSLTLQDIEQAAILLGSHDLVLGPAVDGGYWLIGLRAPQPHLFDQIPWSTSDVLPQTLARAGHLGLRTALLRSRRDIDTETDWRIYLKDPEA